MANTNATKLAFIGCGVMAESMIAGLLRKSIVEPGQMVASHPRPNRREELKAKYGIEVFENNDDAVSDLPSDGTVILSVKPQRLNAAMGDIESVVGADHLVVSIVAGATVGTLTEKLGCTHVVRAMPNTPSQIGAGMTAWTCSPSVTKDQKELVKTILGALGMELYVETENMIDMATSLSATGPTYIFMVMEALTDAGVHLGFSRDVSKQLVQQTMLGSVQFAMESHKHPAELRNMVTSPGGTSAEAIYQMEKGSLRTVLSKAVYSAYKRAVDLGKGS